MCLCVLPVQVRLCPSGSRTGPAMLFISLAVLYALRSIMGSSQYHCSATCSTRSRMAGAICGSTRPSGQAPLSGEPVTVVGDRLLAPTGDLRVKYGVWGLVNNSHFCGRGRVVTGFALVVCFSGDSVAFEHMQAHCSRQRTTARWRRVSGRKTYSKRLPARSTSCPCST